jgi:hypothetical protein
MYGKRCCLVALVCLLGLVGNAAAENLVWDNSSGDSLWRNPENWDLNRLPGTSETEGDAVYINWLGDPTEVLIDADTQAGAWGITVSNDTVGGQGFVHLHVTGGTLVAPNLIRIGRRQLGMFTLDEGTVTCSAFQLGRKDPSKGVVNINGGTITVSTNTRIPRGGSQGSELHLNGGVLYTNGLVMNDPDDPMSGTNGSMDIAGGTLVLTGEGDKTEQIAEYVRNGWITAHGVRSGELAEDGRLGLVQMDYNVTHPGVTTVWAILVDPVRARAPRPGDGATVALADATSLGWTAGQTATRHDVYVGKDIEEVTAADVSDQTGVYRGRQIADIHVFSEALEWGATYYWRVDEIEADNTVQTGPVWSFTVADYLLVDDFETYNDLEVGAPQSNRIFAAWIDGWDDLANGSTVGNAEAPFAEQTIVHGGEQAMPLAYDNNDVAPYSEATVTLDYPRDWTEQGVGVLSLWFRGYPAYVGGFTEAPTGTYTMTAAGKDIWDVSDEFHFAYKKFSGAGTIVAKVESVGNTDEWAKAGVMIRDTLEADARHAMVAVTPGNGVWFGRRGTAGGSTDSTKQAEIVAPQWVKLERTIGGLVRAYCSADGTTWTQFGLAPVLMDMPVYIGLALTSHNPEATCEATFSNVSFPETDVDPQWADQDIGIMANEPEPMYVTVANADDIRATVVHLDPNAVLMEDWTEWRIDLNKFSDGGVDLTDVHKLSIRFGGEADDQDGFGKMYFDDIRLYRPAPEPPQAASVQ